MKYEKEWDVVSDKLHDWNPDVEPCIADMRILRAVRYIAYTKKDAVILDIGCGEGDLLRLLFKMGYKNLTGTEISERRISVAKEKNEDINYMHSNNLMDFDNESIDTLISTGVIEHLENPEEFISECSRILKPNGQLIITTNCYFWRVQKALGLYRTVMPIDDAPFPTTLINWGKKNGLDIVHYDAWGSFLFHPYFAITNVMSIIIPKFIKQYFISTYEKGLTTTYNPKKEEHLFLQSVPISLKTSKLAILKCIFLIDDIFYFQKKLRHEFITSV
jgi:SAM-dependent methyltransferase